MSASSITTEAPAANMDAMDAAGETASEHRGRERVPRPHVACLVDGSDASLRAVPVARRLCADGGRLTIVLVDRWARLALAASAWGQDMEMLREGGEAWLREQLHRLDLTDVDAVVLEAVPVALRGWADRDRPDLIVAAERAGLARLAWGSVAGDLANTDPCPLLLVRQERRTGGRGRLGRVVGRRRAAPQVAPSDRTSVALNVS